MGMHLTLSVPSAVAFESTEAVLRAVSIPSDGLVKGWAHRQV